MIKKLKELIVKFSQLEVENFKAVLNLSVIVVLLFYFLIFLFILASNRVPITLSSVLICIINLIVFLRVVAIVVDNDLQGRTQEDSNFAYQTLTQICLNLREEIADLNEEKQVLLKLCDRRAKEKLPKVKKRGKK